jgi:signal transduction histidine kinase
MSTHQANDRRVVTSLLTLSAAVVIAGNVFFFATAGPGYFTLYVLFGSLSLVMPLFLYLRGYEWARLLAVITLTITMAGFTPEPYLSQDFAVSILLPSVFALIVADARWVIGSALITYSILIARGGPDSIYLEPGGILVTVMLIGGMALSRQLTDAARARVEEQAHQLHEERGLLEQRVAERTSDLAAANDELREAGKHRDLFLAGVSHELRTPLNIILGNVELMSDGVYGPMVPRQLRALATIDESGQHLLRLINDLLDMARLQAGGFTLDRTAVAIHELCVQCARLMRTEMERKELSFTLELDPTALLIEGDPQRVRQILLNLLGNAVKFTHPGGQITLRAHATDDGMVELMVTDTGIGIPADQLDQLFKPFSQVDRRLSRQYGGTGLGLALVAQLAALHGGLVGVSSTPGTGSSFWVRLPTPGGSAAPAPAAL